MPLAPISGAVELKAPVGASARNQSSHFSGGDSVFSTLSGPTDQSPAAQSVARTRLSTMPGSLEA